MNYQLEDPFLPELEILSILPVRDSMSAFTVNAPHLKINDRLFFMRSILVTDEAICQEENSPSPTLSLPLLLRVRTNRLQRAGIPIKYC
jgi:hypothetical protein